MRIDAQKLLQYTTAELYEILTGDFVLVIAGEEVEVTCKEVLYSSYFWDIHRTYPAVPLLKKHLVNSVLKNRKLSYNTHVQLLNNIFWTALDTYNAQGIDIRDDLLKLVYQITNNIYNDLTYKAEEYVTSIDILDFINVSTNDKIEQAFELIDNTPDSIQECYSRIKDVIATAPELSNNQLVKAIRSGIVNESQILQCVGPRGYVPEVDGAIMPRPITRSYTQGMRSLYDAVAESRTAAKSHYYSASPLEESEYFARKLQLMSMIVQRVVPGDCGSNEYIPWFVNPPKFKHDRKVYKGDLEFLIGKYYLDETTNTLKPIDSTCTHLNNTHIKLRSVIKCKHPIATEVCEVCFGRMYDNIIPTGNLGHVCAGTMTQKETQPLLSVKHVDFSALTNPIVFTEELRRFFMVTSDHNTYTLKPEYKDKGLKLVIAREEAIGLVDIMLVEDIHSIGISRVASLNRVGFVYNNISVDTPMPVRVEQYGNNAMMSTELLEHIRKLEWPLATNNSQSFVIDLKDWDYDKPIFKLPDMEYSYLKHSKQVASIIAGTMDDIENKKSKKNRLEPGYPERLLTTLFETVTLKIDVNIALLEVIIYSAMITNLARKDYRLPRNIENEQMGVLEDIIKNRSLGSAYPYESQINVMMNPASFYAEGRPDSVFDVFIAPHEYLKDRT